jgi:hypothetical protein
MIKIILTFLTPIFGSYYLFGQQIEKIEVPAGVVYNYCSAKTYENSKNVIKENLSNMDEYSLVDEIMFVGPVLWTRFQKIKLLGDIEGGNTTLLVDNNKLSAKLTQSIDDGKKVWNEFRKEIDGKEFTLRKATAKELQYYWSVISFDIEEPLVILETAQERYILNISPKTMKLIWLDQAP